MKDERGTLTIRILDAAGRPLKDKADVMLSRLSPASSAGHWQDVDTAQALHVTQLPTPASYALQVIPERHRPVGEVVLLPVDGREEVEVFCPLLPSAAKLTLPEIFELPADLRSKIGGEAAFKGWTALARAGLLNIWAKLNQEALTRYVVRIYEARPDRIYADVLPALFEVAKQRYVAVNGSLHPAPEGFSCVGSFKSHEPAGNVQLTLFTDGRMWKADCDIDNEAGLAHFFRVLDHSIRKRGTHPVDIREILVRQGIEPGWLAA